MASPQRPIIVAEPPAQYIARRPVVADCSLLCALFFDEPERDQAQRLLAGCHLIAPSLLSHEMLSVALKKLRRGMAAAVVERALNDFLDTDIEILPTEPLSQFALAQRYELTAYDAAYLWLAAELKAPLLTFDQRLGTAAQAHLRSLE